MTILANAVASNNPLKRKISELDEHLSATKIPKYKPVIDWLFDSRERCSSSSAPPCYDLTMSQQPVPLKRESPFAPSVNTTVARTTTTSSNYPHILEGNGLTLDRVGELIPKEIQDFLDYHVLKSRPVILTREEFQEVNQAFKDAANDSESEYLVEKIFQTPMFPTKRPGISEGGKTPFSKEPLPRDSIHADSELCRPKQDIHLGFSLDDRDSFDREQKAVIIHSSASPYTIGTTGNTSFPFLIVEAKAEANGGTPWHAENQAAGGGAHRVNSMRWLYREAGIKPDATQTLAFSICLMSRLVNLYVHYYSPETNEFSMSLVRNYLPGRPQEVQECNWHIANILDFALDTRLGEIKTQLKALHPFPERWARKKQATSTAPTSIASFSTTNAGG